ncbi:cytochrome P450 [Podospora australis]|uniref:Cytochrome P450 n=1 Tax=Podospora australis TaxID=1536484 RepID=A0AAN6WLA9_9PEZI|nr:cytochrome P450 [Podospora australis]
MDSLWNNQTVLVHWTEQQQSSYSQLLMSYFGPSRASTLASVFNRAVPCLLFLVPFILNYAIVLILYRRAYRPPDSEKDAPQCPPIYPHFVPFLGSAISFAFDGVNLIKKATRHAGSLVPVRLSILANEIYLIQGPEVVAAVWKKKHLGSPILIYSFALKHVFGMSEKSLKTYRADDSGSHRRPHPASNVAPHNRVDFVTHVGLLRAFGGSGLNTSFRRCAGLLQRNLSNAAIPKDGSWVEMPDFFAFFQEQLGAAVLEGLYGPALPRLSPHFLQDLWKFDRATPKFAKLTPRFLMRGSYEVRDRLLDAIRRWHRHARQSFDESAIGPDGDADPFWGSKHVRSRQETLLQVDGQDHEAIVAADLGLIWASVTNVVPSSMMCTLYIYRDEKLRDRLRSGLDRIVLTGEDALLAGGGGGGDMMETMLRNPLLSSVYAETLRLHLQAYVTRSCAHEDVTLAGRWVLPRNKVCMVNTYASHMDENFWNTRGGAFPLDTFWAERFLIDPKDAESGPVRMDVPPTQYKKPSPPPAEELAEGQGKFFSVSGLEGAWIPYGGGYAACPGRHFAKRIIFFATTLLLTEYDVEILTRNVEVDTRCFGLGTQKPKDPVRFRIRRRLGRRVAEQPL